MTTRLEPSLRIRVRFLRESFNAWFSVCYYWLHGAEPSLRKWFCFRWSGQEPHGLVGSLTRLSQTLGERTGGCNTVRLQTTTTSSAAKGLATYCREEQHVRENSPKTEKKCSPKIRVAVFVFLRSLNYVVLCFSSLMAVT